MPGAARETQLLAGMHAALRWRAQHASRPVALLCSQGDIERHHMNAVQCLRDANADVLVVAVIFSAVCEFDTLEAFSAWSVDHIGELSVLAGAVDAVVIPESAADVFGEGFEQKLAQRGFSLAGLCARDICAVLHLRSAVPALASLLRPDVLVVDARHEALVGAFVRIPLMLVTRTLDYYTISDARLASMAVRPAAPSALKRRSWISSAWRHVVAVLMRRKRQVRPQPGTRASASPPGSRLAHARSKSVGAEATASALTAIFNVAECVRDAGPCSTAHACATVQSASPPALDAVHDCRSLYDFPETLPHSAELGCMIRAARMVAHNDLERIGRGVLVECAAALSAELQRRHYGDALVVLRRESKRSPRVSHVRVAFVHPRTLRMTEPSPDTWLYLCATVEHAAEVHLLVRIDAAGRIVPATSV